jgi:hypothetical protein
VDTKEDFHGVCFDIYTCYIPVIWKRQCFLETLSRFIPAASTPWRWRASTKSHADQSFFTGWTSWLKNQFPAVQCHWLYNVWHVTHTWDSLLWSCGMWALLRGTKQGYSAGLASASHWVQFPVLKNKTKHVSVDYFFHLFCDNSMSEQTKNDMT